LNEVELRHTSRPSVGDRLRDALKLLSWLLIPKMVGDLSILLSRLLITIVVRNLVITLSNWLRGHLSASISCIRVIVASWVSPLRGTMLSAQVSLAREFPLLKGLDHWALPTDRHLVLSILRIDILGEHISRLARKPCRLVATMFFGDSWLQLLLGTSTHCIPGVLLLIVKWGVLPPIWLSILSLVILVFLGLDRRASHRVTGTLWFISVFSGLVLRELVVGLLQGLHGLVDC
jgi:hypothetical protein